MKQLDKILIVALMVISLTSNAQDKNNKWALGFGVNAVDTKTSAGGGKGWADRHFSQAFGANDNWNILRSISYLTVSRYVGDNFSVALTGSVNKINKAVYFRPSAPGHDSRGYVVTNPGDLMYYGIDGAIKYSFMNMIKSKVIDPSLSLGGGYTFLGKNSFGTVNPGAGLTLWFSKNVGFSLATVYKKSFGDRESAGVIDSPSHFQHTAGIVFRFGGKDTDGDGIYDKDDACPDVAGLKQFNGCPDTDGDGIADKDDACPDAAGSTALNGCPDTDGDGIYDKDDACPTAAGSKAMKGCPDTDGDGIADKDDKCPSVKGPRENGGCPWPDRDGDSVLDKDDNCPDVKGTVTNKGCPEVAAVAPVAPEAIYFNTGKSDLKSSDATSKLDAIVKMISTSGSAKVSVEGHADNVGSDKLNQKLSVSRANAVKKALVGKGIKAKNVTVKGYGESNPISTNDTEEGRAKNRRVEVKVVK